jgi:hypothetical protein
MKFPKNFQLRVKTLTHGAGEHYSLPSSKFKSNQQQTSKRGDDGFISSPQKKLNSEWPNETAYTIQPTPFSSLSLTSRPNKGCVTWWPCHLHSKVYVKAKEESWKLKYFPMQKPTIVPWPFQHMSIETIN